MGTRRSFARIVGVCTAAVLTAALTTQTAQARDADGRYYQPPTPYHDSDRYDPGCGHLDVSARFWVHGVDSLTFVPGSNGQAFFLEDTFRFFEKWRDSSGHTILTWRGHFHFKEFFAKRVWKGQVPADVIPPEGLVGPIYLFKARQSGVEVVRDDDGKLLHRTHGMEAFANLVDTLGDHKPGATSLHFEVTKKRGNFPPLSVEQVCELAKAELSD
jgi:hypothetical protein